MLGTSSSNLDKSINESLARINPKSILELGCGMGKLGELIKSLGLTVNITAIQKLFSQSDHDLLISKGYNKIVDSDILEYFKIGFDENYELTVIMDVIEHFLYSDALSIIDFALYRSDWLLLVWPSKHPQAATSNQFDRHRTSFEIDTLTSKFDVVYYEQRGFAQVHFLHRYHLCVIRGHMNSKIF